MAAETTTNRVELLKKLWGDKVYAPVYDESKFIYKVRKNKGFDGEARYVVVENSPLAGASSDMATAIANEAAGVDKRFTVYRKKEYVSFSIENELYLAAKSKGKGSLVEIMKQKSKQAMYKHARAAASRAWGNGGGSIGVIDATTTLSTTTLILDNPTDITRFEVGMKIQASDDDGTPASPAGLRASTALTVTSISGKGSTEDSSTLVMSGVLTGIAAIATGDYLFRQGDYGNAMTGVPGWNPTTAPSSGESFFGVDRTLGDTQRLIGVISTASGSTTYEQKLVRAAMRGKICGVKVNTCFVNPIDFGEIALEVGAAKQTMVSDKTYGISFNTININGPNGLIEIIPETDVPMGFYWMTDMSQWELFSLGDFPMELTDNGNVWVTYKEGSDEWRGRLGSYANFLNENPGNGIQGAF